MARDKELVQLKRQHTMRLGKLLARSYYLHQRKRKREMYNLICDEFVALGGVYVKFLQGVLLTNPVFRDWQSRDRLKIFEDLDPEPLDIVAVLRREIKPEQLKEISLVQPEPFAAGSFGQVYLGQHRNGNKIVIKALRPQMRALLKHDLKLIGVFSRHFVKNNYENMDVNMDNAIQEFREATLRETDYISEA
ncbi:MAG: AarF/UbiB family protein, partial [Candidatus Saccharimonadales bacterium]